jgi:hypothetical protein
MHALLLSIQLPPARFGTPTQLLQDDLGPAAAVSLVSACLPFRGERAAEAVPLQDDRWHLGGHKCDV